MKNFHNVFHFQDKTGLTGAMARNIAGLPSSESSSTVISNFVPSQASADVEELPEDYHLKEIDLKQSESIYMEESSALSFTCKNHLSLSLPSNSYVSAHVVSRAAALAGVSAVSEASCVVCEAQSAVPRL